MEGSHELSNVIGNDNAKFWLAAEDAGSPLKIFRRLARLRRPPCMSVPAVTTVSMKWMRFLKSDLRVVALGEVMDWPAVSNPGAPGSQRIWEMIQATWANRGVVEGHGSGLFGVDQINAFAASGLESDHEVRLAQEGLEKLRRGVFLEVRTRVLLPYSFRC